MIVRFVTHVQNQDQRQIVGRQKQRIMLNIQRLSLEPEVIDWISRGNVQLEVLDLRLYCNMLDLKTMSVHVTRFFEKT